MSYVASSTSLYKYDPKYATTGLPTPFPTATSLANVIYNIVYNPSSNVYNATLNRAITVVLPKVFTAVPSGDYTTVAPPNNTTLVAISAYIDAVNTAVSTTSYSIFNTTASTINPNMYQYILSVVQFLRSKVYDALPVAIKPTSNDLYNSMRGVMADANKNIYFDSAKSTKFSGITNFLITNESDVTYTQAAAPDAVSVGAITFSGSAATSLGGLGTLGTTASSGPGTNSYKAIQAGLKVYTALSEYPKAVGTPAVTNATSLSSGSINENHTSRVEFTAADLSSTNMAVINRWSSTLGKPEDRVVIALRDGVQIAGFIGISIPSV
jgi:hypothetical protein